jgi:hypothetical protein
MKISDLILYQRLDTITAQRALDLAIDGEVQAFYMIDTDVDVYGPEISDSDGVKWVGTHYGKWHSITVRLPRGLLFKLALAEEVGLADSTGKPTGLTVDSTLHPELPKVKTYMLYPKGQAIRLERNKLFFMANDMEALTAKLGSDFALANTSDAALGADIRKQRESFANIKREQQTAREVEYVRWSNAATEIQQKMTREASKRELADKVKEYLQLPDSVETIRKRIVNKIMS